MLLDGKECIHEVDQVCMTIFLEMFTQVLAGHPFRYDLGGVEGETLEGHDIQKALTRCPHQLCTYLF